jgi:hypothetical protein
VADILLRAASKFIAAVWTGSSAILTHLAKARTPKDRAAAAERFEYFGQENAIATEGVKL